MYGAKTIMAAVVAVPAEPDAAVPRKCGKIPVVAQTRSAQRKCVKIPAVAHPEIAVGGAADRIGINCLEKHFR